MNTTRLCQQNLVTKKNSVEAHICTYISYTAYVKGCPYERVCYDCVRVKAMISGGKKYIDRSQMSISSE